MTNGMVATHSSGLSHTNSQTTMAKQQTKWNLHLMQVYREMKAKDSSVKLKDAMKVAKKSYKMEDK
jgi:hypothetical protein